MAKWWLVALLMVVNTGVRAEPVDFTLPDAQGKQRSLSEFRGKWVVVNFWATWCPPCRDEIPDLVAFHEKHKAKDAVVLGIDFEDIPVGQLQAFVHEYEMSYPVLRNTSDDPPHARMQVDNLPTSYIISPEGELVARQVGVLTGENIEKFIANETRERAASKAQPVTNAGSQP